MRYEEPESLPHGDAEAVFASGDDRAICEALVGAALHDSDAAWVESWCNLLATTGSLDVRRVAATCLGHVARRFGAVRPDSVALLQRMQDDPALSGAAADALEDIDQFTTPAD